jgi:AmiR/NasT family two-component response regulator
VSKRLNAVQQPVEISTLVRNLRNHKILLLMPEGENRTKMEQQIRRIGCRLHAQWPPPQEIDSFYQIVILGLTSVMENDQAFHWDVSHPPAALVLVVDYENPLVLQYSLSLNAQAIIGLPFHPMGVMSNLLLSLQEYKQTRSMLKTIRNLELKLSASEHIEKAKHFLSQTQGISLEKAYRAMRQLAMERRQPIGEMAKEIIAERTIVPTDNEST